MPSPVKPWRVIVKAVLILGVLNFAFIDIEPWLADHQVYNLIVPGRLRLPFAGDNQEMLSYNENLSDDYDAMFASHVISGRYKQPDEYRVILIGDSSMWGYNLPPADILSEQMNRLSLLTCQGKSIRFYDLAYLGTYVPKDLLVLERAVQDQPDLIIWGVTLNALATHDAADLAQIEPQADEMLRLVRGFGLKLDTSRLQPPSMFQKTALGGKGKIRRWAVFQFDGLLWAATGIDLNVRNFPPPSNNVSADVAYYGNASLHLRTDRLSFDVIRAGYELAGHVPVLVVNEPIFVANGKNSNVRYNLYYPRWAYDQYREWLSAQMRANGYRYLDLWNMVPSSLFGDTPLHLTSAGESRLAADLVPDIQAIACP